MPANRFTSPALCLRAVLILTLALTLFGASPALARGNSLEPVTWYVATTGADSNSCTAFDAPCLTINGAIAKAAAGDIVKVAIGTYVGSGTEVVLINKDITLLGGWVETFSAQNGLSTVDGENARRGGYINDGITAVIDRFAIQHGFASDDGGGICSYGTLALSNSIVSNSLTEAYYPTLGGGIYSYGTLTISNSIVTDNKSAIGGGIGIASEGALSLTNSIVSGNWAGMTGGGIHSYGSITLIGSVVSGNSAGESGGGINGAGMTITDSTIRNNTVRDITLYGGGGGITAGYGSVVLNNTTISGNKSYQRSGISVIGGGAPAVFNNTTISGNTGGEAIYSSGSLALNNSTVTGNTSGILNDWGTTTLRNSILAGNTGYDCSGSITSSGYNLIGRKTTDCDFTETTGDKVGMEASPIKPRLTPLASHGGPNFTHALMTGSPALDAGNPAAPGSEENACLAADQRSVARPVDGVCDMGSYEGHVLGVVSILRLDPSPTSASSVRFKVKFSDAVTGVDTAAPFADFSLTKTGILGASITSVSGSGDTYTVTVNTGRNNGTLRLNVLDNDSILDGSANPLGGPDAGNGKFMTGQTYTVKKIPTAISPANITSWDSTPTYKWSKIPGATQYSYQLMKGTTLVYSKTVLAGACGSTTCLSTPPNLLLSGVYKWRVRAMTEGTWKSFSPYKSFTIIRPKAGYWKGYGVDFYVTPNQGSVDDYSIYISVSGCGNYKVTHTALVPIVNRKFAFTGSFYASGTFSSTTNVSGMLGLKSYYIPGCGYVSGGPFYWSAAWLRSSQPDPLAGLQVDPFFLLLPELKDPFPQMFTVDPIP